ncbi:alanine racemase [Candidatus Venteria ishoeyi]|uniref:Alanine racemase n=1 Tax=Candidatus Venteria ishoeyi TaxID=1899563 RepID=A0A1H6FBY8_9GAMM|nr:alanine racemase [Candidatus Venteria ishoeyi]SEH07163.1 Alanine racemase [Candidatus Venteria ishoeyi]
MRPTHALIDLQAISDNFRCAQAAAPLSKNFAVIKADAYGHGLLPVAQTLASAGANGFAVACLEEALVLREAGIQLPILLLEGFFEAAELPIIAQQQLQIVLHSPWQVAQLLDSQLPTPIAVWLKLDTGMGRLGFRPEQFKQAWQQLQTAPTRARPIRLMTHLACADERNNPMTQRQVTTFQQQIQHISCETSIANSAGILGWPESHAHWNRPGIMLYGAAPFNDDLPAVQGLTAAMSLSSRIISIKQCQAGDTLGYGATWACPQTMPVAAVSIGYGDGYPRHAPPATPVWLNKQRVKLVGRVSMDMITLDLRECPDAQVGDKVELWGQHIPVDEIARLSGTIGYELLTGVTKRVPRYYQ